KTKKPLKPKKLKKRLFASSWSRGASKRWKQDYYDKKQFKKYIPPMYDSTEKEKPLFRVMFEDGSVFTLPQEWEGVFVEYFGVDVSGYKKLAERVRFVTGKYIKNRAFPSKFDGLQWQDDDKPFEDSVYDDPEFYWERWDDWEEHGREWNRL